MDAAISAHISAQTAESQSRLTAVFVRERSRLTAFARQRLGSAAEAEDLVQDTFAELVETVLVSEPVEQVGAWLFRVARNRIVDRFRKKKELPLPEDDDGDGSWLERQLPDPRGGPDAEYARAVLLAEIEAALDELPPEQRDVFLAHEVDGVSFRDMAEATGVNQNTLLARKRYAVQHLRRRLAALQDNGDAL